MHPENHSLRRREAHTEPFQKRSVTRTHAIVSGIHHTIAKGQEGVVAKSVSECQMDSIRHRSITHRCLDSNQVSGNPDSLWTHYLTFASSILGELLPPAPRTCFGRGELIDSEDCRSGRKPDTRRSSYRCRGDRKDVCRSHRSPSRPYQTTIW